MTHLSLAILPIVFGLNILFGFPIPVWMTGVLATSAAILFAMRCLGLPKYGRRARYPATRGG